MVKTLPRGTWALKHKLAILILLLVYLGVFSCRAQAQDTTPPVFQSATIDGATLTATYNEDLKGDFTGTVFVVRINGRWVGVSRAGTTSERNAIVTLNYWSRARPGDRVTLSYMVPASPSADPLIDDSGNSAGPFTNFPVTNITPDDPPELWQANLKDNKIILLYDDELNANWRPPTSAYRVVHEGVEVTVTKVDVTRSDPTSSVILTGKNFPSNGRKRKSELHGAAGGQQQRRARQERKPGSIIHRRVGRKRHDLDGRPQAGAGAYGDGCAESDPGHRVSAIRQDPVAGRARRYVQPVQSAGERL